MDNDAMEGLLYQFKVKPDSPRLKIAGSPLGLHPLDSELGRAIEFGFLNRP
jgi:hypothetical protein